DDSAATSVKVGYRQAVIPKRARYVIVAGFFHLCPTHEAHRSARFAWLRLVGFFHFRFKRCLENGVCHHFSGNISEKRGPTPVWGMLGRG
ncbi:hypothetical protein, partial [Pseudoduganella flava]|uniref:hypothetical protein n=1 Tax=Pseudoduganella flava TaxID=871742 RepID=UPI001A7F0763